MKKLILSACLALFAFSAFAATPAKEAETRKQVNAFIDEWHDDAAHARLAYFDKMATDGIYIGTDKTELWNRDQFKAWARRYFERKSAWAFKATKRNVYMSDDAKFIWSSDGHHELYDLLADPGETHDVAAERPGQAVEMARRLADWVAARAPTQSVPITSPGRDTPGDGPDR